MLKMISVGLVYDHLHKQFLVVKQPEDRHWSLPQSNVLPGQHPATALVDFIESTTAVVAQPNKPCLGTSLPDFTVSTADRDEWPRIYWLCFANGCTPRVIRGPGRSVIAAEYVDRSAFQDRLSNRMPKPFGMLLASLG